MKNESYGDNVVSGQRSDLVGQRRLACVDAAGGELLMFVDGYDSAIVGVAEVNSESRVVYDSEAIVCELMRRDGAAREGAVEFFEHNGASAAGNGPYPLFLRVVR